MVLDEHTPSENLMKQFDKVLEENATLRRENQMLKNENMELKRKILQRSQCFTVPKGNPH